MIERQSNGTESATTNERESHIPNGECERVEGSDVKQRT